MSRKTALGFLLLYLFLVLVMLATANQAHAITTQWEMTPMGFMKMTTLGADGSGIISWHDIVKQEISRRSEMDLQKESIQQGVLVKCHSTLTKGSRYCYWIRYEPSFIQWKEKNDGNVR